jgi:hypothetical protein
VDWEATDDLAPPFTDLFHFVVQAHALLKRPRRGTVLRGLDGHGWIGRAIRAYSESAELAPDTAVECFRAYLTASMDKLDLATHPGRIGWTARKQLLDARQGMAG